jgi:hypothetical protein
MRHPFDTRTHHTCATVPRRGLLPSNASSDDTMIEEKQMKKTKDSNSGTGLHLVDVGLSRALVDRREEGVHLGVFGEPCGHLTEFFA